MSLTSTFVLKPGALERLLKDEPGVQPALDEAAHMVQSNAISNAASNGHRYSYHTRSYRNNAGFPHAGVFISWKRPSKEFGNALDYLRNSL